MSGLDSKYGGRNRSGRGPTTDPIAALAASSSAKIAARSRSRSSGWVCVWFATSWPSATHRRSVSSRPSIATPQTKNVARAPAAAKQVEDLLRPERRAVVERKRDERRADLSGDGSPSSPR